VTDIGYGPAGPETSVEARPSPRQGDEPVPEAAGSALTRIDATGVEWVALEARFPCRPGPWQASSVAVQRTWGDTAVWENVTADTSPLHERAVEIVRDGNPDDYRADGSWPARHADTAVVVASQLTTGDLTVRLTRRVSVPRGCSLLAEPVGEEISAGIWGGNHVERRLVGVAGDRVDVGAGRQ
jgi:hypothetical protein